MSYQTELQATAVAVSQQHCFAGPTVVDACLRGYFVEPLTAAAAAADFEGYSAALAISAAAAAAAASPQQCFVVQLTGFETCSLYLIVAPLAAAVKAIVAAASFVFAADEYQKPVEVVAAA